MISFTERIKRFYYKEIAPYITAAVVPNTITGPAILNIFAPTPRIKPSAAVNIGPINFVKILTLNQRCGMLVLQ